MVWRNAIVLYAALTVLTGIVYPLVVTGIADVVFPHEAKGSLITSSRKVIGSEQIGQQFSDPRYFWGRPSATSPAYDGAASSGSNLGPNHPDLAKAVQERVAALRAADPWNAAAVPIDLVTASGSGLDPDVSPAGALYQAGRVARARGITEKTVRALIVRSTEGRTFGILGEPHVNVLKLNLALDLIQHPRPAEE
jgi:K+-transporting ATPase ATPase C chain